MKVGLIPHFHTTVLTVKDAYLTVMGHFENTPPALGNFSPGFERSENPGFVVNDHLNPVGVRLPPNPFRVLRVF